MEEKGRTCCGCEQRKATDVLVTESLQRKEVETFVITADTKADPSARTAFAVIVKCMLVWLASLIGWLYAADRGVFCRGEGSRCRVSDNRWLFYTMANGITINKDLVYKLEGNI